MTRAAGRRSHSLKYMTREITLLCESGGEPVLREILDGLGLTVVHPARERGEEELQSEEVWHVLPDIDGIRGGNRGHLA